MKTQTIPKNTDERRAWIKYQLELRGHSFASIAREIGVARTCPQSALRRHYPKMERIIAAKLDMQPEDIWPERYEAKNEKPRKRQCRKSTKAHKTAQ